MTNRSIFFSIWLFISVVLQSDLMIAQNDSIQPYIRFLEDQNTNCIDYILKSFDTSHIVVIGERDHREMTQYYFIENLISQESFQAEVGVIFTEVGNYSLNSTLNKLLWDSEISAEVFQRKILEVFRDISYYPVWQNYNFYYFLTSVWKVNQQLTDEFKIKVIMTGPSIHWDEIKDTEDYYNWYKTSKDIVEYDKIIAENILNYIDSDTISFRKKYLTILNHPHCFKSITFSNSKNRNDFTTSFIKEAYPNTKTIMINTVGNFDYRFWAIANGKWDAAFEKLHKSNTGFDLANSPFGNDLFDTWSSDICKSRYYEVFDGMIYINPVKDFRIKIGIPKMLRNGFAKELKRREDIYTRKNTSLFSIYYNYWGVTIYKHDNWREIEKQIQNWIVD